MNWFQRYGIPGAYFVGLMAGWVYAFYPNLLENHTCRDPQWLLALAAIIFLPIGYVISIFSQFVYLKSCLGVHKAAATEVDVFKLERNNEWVLETESLLLSALKPGITVNTHKHMRDWIARRTDVMAINGSLIIATVLAPVAALSVQLCPELSFRCTGGVTITLILVSLALLAIMCCSYCVLRKQVIRVIVGVYREYKRWNIL